MSVSNKTILLIDSSFVSLMNIILIHKLCFNLNVFLLIFTFTSDIIPEELVFNDNEFRKQKREEAGEDGTGLQQCPQMSHKGCVKAPDTNFPLTYLLL